MAVAKFLRVAGGAVLFVVGMLGGNYIYKWLQDHSEGNTVAQSMVSQHRPDFSLPDVKGTLHSVGEWDGKVTVVNFWATWCPPCVKETPAFVELQQKYAQRGVQFVGIALDTKDKVVDFINQNGVNYPTLLGDEALLEKVAKAYGNRYGALPYTAIINRRGDIAFIQRGELSEEVAEQTIQSLL